LQSLSTSVDYGYGSTPKYAMQLDGKAGATNNMDTHHYPKILLMGLRRYTVTITRVIVE
jgi:hypothetical protein